MCVAAGTMQRGEPTPQSDDELQEAIRASLQEEEQERKELEFALSQSLQSAEEDKQKAAERARREEEEKEKKKAAAQARRDQEQREKEEQERQRRRNTRERAAGDGGEADEQVEVVTLSVFSLVLLLSDDELLLRAMRDHDVVVDIPPLSGEDESFLVITGRTRRGVEAAKQMLLARLAQEQQQRRREPEEAPDAAPVAMVMSPPPRAPARKSETHIFVDSSNILIGANVKIDVPAFCRLVEGDRSKIVSRFAIGSPVKGYGNLEAIWKGCGYGARGFQSRGKEELHDDALQNMISGLLFQGFKNRSGGGKQFNGKTIVLCTGDGNSHGRDQGGQDFPSLVKVALSMGFEVEVWAWRSGCSNKYTAFLVCENFSLFFLDDHLDVLVPRK